MCVSYRKVTTRICGSFSSKKAQALLSLSWQDNPNKGSLSEGEQPQKCSSASWCAKSKDPTNAELNALCFLLSGVIFLTCQGTQEQITPLTALVPSDSFSNYLDSLSHLLLSASVLSCCCCCVVLPLLLSDKPPHLCLLCCRCRLTRVTLSLSFCRWKMHWMRQTFSSSWTCTLLIVNNSKYWFKVQLVMWGSVQLENYFDEMSPF